jgi:eukaryotic-like serine/threonine-protein kinase
MNLTDLPGDELMLGRLIANRYLVEEVCERTATSVSYRAYHLAIDRSVLLRALPGRAGLTRDACRRALKLAESAASLPSPHVARTLDVGLVAGRWPFFVSEYSKGRTLEAVLRQSGPLGVPRVLAIARQLSSAVSGAHAAGLAHGGLALDTLWLESLECRPEWLRVMGFGLSELLDSALDGAASGVFMSAVRHGTDVSPGCSPTKVRADIHALGECLYELASGSRAPFVEQRAAGIVDSDFAGREWTGRRALLRAFAMIVQRCLYRLPSGNYDSMAEVSRDLEALEKAGAVVAADAAGRAPVTAVHAPARRARVTLSQPKVIVRGT